MNKQILKVYHIKNKTQTNNIFKTTIKSKKKTKGYTLADKQQPQWLKVEDTPTVTDS